MALFENDCQSQSSSAETSLRSVEDKHWVADLFPPAFGFTVDEILADIGLEKEKEQSAFEKYARSVNPLDTAAIKNVYERVWLMLDIEKKELLKQKMDKECVGDLQHIKSGVAGLQVRDADTSTTELDQEPKYDVHDSCIWSDSEIQVLREVFQTARKQNRDLEAELAEVKDRYDTLHKREKDKSADLDRKNRALAEALRANQRLHMLSEKLNKDCEKANADVKKWKQEVYKLKEDRSIYMDKLHEKNIAYNHQRLQKDKIQSDLIAQNKQSLQAQILREERLSVNYNKNMNALVKQVETLKEQLEEEKASHQRTTRGLEHLRTHFSSLPHTGLLEWPSENKEQVETGAEAYVSGWVQCGMVTEDQLKTWTY